jgi:uncharacterized protein (TIRG00374 family)
VVALAVWSFSSMDRSALLKALESADPRLLLASALVNILALAVQSLRWRSLLSPMARVRRRDAFVGLTMGFALSAVLPARLGEVVRVRLVARRAGVPMAAVAGSTVLDHVMNAITMVPLLAVLVGAGGLPHWARRGAAVVLVVAVGIGLATWAAALHETEMPRKSGFRARVHELRVGLVAMRSPRPLVGALFWGLLAWGAEGATAYLALEAFGLDLGMSSALLVLVAVNMLLAAPSPPANVGTFEIGAVLALAGLGVPREAALAFALGYHVLQLVSVGAVATAAWPMARKA